MNALAKILLIAWVIVLFQPSRGLCTAEYAAQMGKHCGYCHLDPAGGGPLTRDGETFKDGLRIKDQYRVLNPVQHVIRFVIGYLHTMTAISGSEQSSMCILF